MAGPEVTSQAEVSKLRRMEGMADTSRDARLLSRGRRLEAATLSWNIIGVAVLAFAAVQARSVALAGFGLDSLIEIGASTVVLWELADVSQERQHRAMRFIGIAFICLAVYLAIQSTVVLVIGFHPHHSPLGIVWAGVTAACHRSWTGAGQGQDGRGIEQSGASSRGSDHDDRRHPGHSGPGWLATQYPSWLVVG